MWLHYNYSNAIVHVYRCSYLIVIGLIGVQFMVLRHNLLKSYTACTYQYTTVLITTCRYVQCRGFIRSRLPAVYRRLCCHQFASHRRLLWPGFHSNPYSDRRLL